MCTFCAEKLRKWRTLNRDSKLLDLKDAYLQLRMDEEFWPYQVVYFKGKSYCLTRLGFGLNSAPRIMTHVLRKVLSMDREISEGTDNYIDDIIVNESIISAEKVKDHLSKYGLECKPTENVFEARVLGLQMCERDGTLRWCRSNVVPEILNTGEELSRREYFSICGKLLGHYPYVAGYVQHAAMQNVCVEVNGGLIRLEFSQ